MQFLPLTQITQQLGVSPVTLTSLFVVIVVWSIFWKGWALWTAAQRREFVWFFVILLVNTLGILEIIYLFVLKKRDGGVAP